MRELTGKVAVVTGAASGIGRATARAFARRGMAVVLADIEEAPLQKAAAELAEGGAAATAVVCDVSSAEQVEALAARAVDEHGGVHLVHLNAGVGSGGPMWTLTERDWQWVLGVNLWGVIHGVRAFVPRMLESGEEGHVVVTASMAGLTSSPFMGPYNVSKHGAVTLAETLQKELTMTGSRVGVSLLCPGWVNTAIGESGRNRPAALTDDGGSGGLASNLSELGGGMVRQMLESGLDPADVAEQVVEAVVAGRFYVLTHPEWKDMIRTRMDDILDGRTPGGPVLPA